MNTITNMSPNGYKYFKFKNIDDYDKLGNVLVVSTDAFFKFNPNLLSGYCRQYIPNHSFRHIKALIMHYMFPYIRETSNPRLNKLNKLCLLDKTSLNQVSCFDDRNDTHFLDYNGKPKRLFVVNTNTIDNEWNKLFLPTNDIKTGNNIINIEKDNTFYEIKSEFTDDRITTRDHVNFFIKFGEMDIRDCIQLLHEIKSERSQQYGISDAECIQLMSLYNKYVHMFDDEYFVYLKHDSHFGEGLWRKLDDLFDPGCAIYPYYFNNSIPECKKITKNTNILSYIWDEIIGKLSSKFRNKQFTSEYQISTVHLKNRKDLYSSIKQMHERQLKDRVEDDQRNNNRCRICDITFYNHWGLRDHKKTKEHEEVVQQRKYATANEWMIGIKGFHYIPTTNKPIEYKNDDISEHKNNDNNSNNDNIPGNSNNVNPFSKSNKINNINNKFNNNNSNNNNNGSDVNKDNNKNPYRNLKKKKNNQKKKPNAIPNNNNDSNPVKSESGTHNLIYDNSFIYTLIYTDKVAKLHEFKDEIQEICNEWVTIIKNNNVREIKKAFKSGIELMKKYKSHYNAAKKSLKKEDKNIEKKFKEGLRNWINILQKKVQKQQKL